MKDIAYRYGYESTSNAESRNSEEGNTSGRENS